MNVGSTLVTSSNLITPKGPTFGHNGWVKSPCFNPSIIDVNALVTSIKVGRPSPFNIGLWQSQDLNPYLYQWGMDACGKNTLREYDNETFCSGMQNLNSQGQRYQKFGNVWLVTDLESSCHLIFMLFPHFAFYKERGE